RAHNDSLWGGLSRARAEWVWARTRPEPIDDTDILKALGYEVLDELGSGSFGTVTLAKSKKHQKNLAIKTMDRRWMIVKFSSSVLKAELDTIYRLTHPHIVYIYEVIEVRHGQVHIVMEAASSSLVEVIEKGPVAHKTARRWFSQIVSALNYMHEQDIVHRDLKCDNILVTADGNVKIADFGLSRVTKGLCNSMVGTLWYVSPEVIREKKYDAKKSDVWSLGIVLYALVTGELPSYSDDLEQIASPKLPYTFPDDVEVEESCRALILDMLQLDPSARPTVKKVSEHPWLQSDVKDTPTSEEERLETPTSGDKRSETPTSEVKKSETSTSEDGSSVMPTSGDKRSETPTSEVKKSETSTSEDGSSEMPTSEDERSETPADLKDHSSGASVELMCPSLEVVQEDAGARITCPAVEDVEDTGCGCFGRIPPFQAAVKRRGAACAKAFRSFGRRVKKFFRRKILFFCDVLI
uniref:non-specific serine/threonine protein kinase n=1 Tax=Astyanax mexicanus TaxID=7994 RepID=A0A3B1JC95_ASTMX